MKRDLHMRFPNVRIPLTFIGTCIKCKAKGIVYTFRAFGYISNKSRCLKHYNHCNFDLLGHLSPLLFRLIQRQKDRQ